MVFLKFNICPKSPISKKKMPKHYQKPADYFSNFAQWPEDWMVIDEDLVIGNNLLELFTPFIENLIKEELAIKTIKNHMGNLMLLGEEIIRRLNDDDEDNRKLMPKKLLLEYIDEEYGPLLLHWDPNDPTEEAHLKAFDATCRKLFKFIMTSN